MTSEEKTSLIAGAADELKAETIRILDVREQTQIADFFVICSGSSDTHIRAIAGNIIDKMVEAGFKKPRREGVETALWVLLDYEDVVVHIFAHEAREYYSLESFWSGAKVTELVEKTRAQDQAAA